MMRIQMFRRSPAWLAVLALGLLSACGGGGDHDQPAAAATASADVTTQVPAAAATEAAAATSYVAALSSEPEAKTDVLEPVAVPDMLATDETAEPT
ncbi:hypothetical protein [Aquabacterium sp.]|uniref:hypothetical protein n=1 Tax=Aquabacterium sp. TaxID=1872578 RepID=UPI001DD3DAE6|nr:hypothetical protein [Aquabacterium sp.]MBT9610521.1 hypothetical protein [Aquabacterium sp.]